jgi:hypothetical protein
MLAPRCVALATAIFLAVSSLTAAQGIPASGGEIRGRVINATTKAPITMAKVAAATDQAPMTVEQGRNASRTRFTLAARKKLMEDRMSVTLRVIDPFNTSRESNTTIDPRFYQVSDRRRVIRGLLVSVNWTFGKPQEEHTREQNDLGGDVGPP